jgi:hypothetical protein
MAEFSLSRHVESSMANRVETWIGSPPRGPSTGAWANTSLADRREFLWAMATQLGDFIALRSADMPPCSWIVYASERMGMEHPEAWRGFSSAHEGHERESRERKIYRLSSLVAGVVTTTVVAGGNQLERT